MLQPALYLKRVIPACGRMVLPRTGHTLNPEEPGLFNLPLAEFLVMAEAGRWSARDARANPAEVMKVS